jgi:hypothetical protein
VNEVTTAESPATLLGALDDEAFARVVRGNLGSGENYDAVWAELTDHRVIQRTQSVLAAMRADVDVQLGRATADLRDEKNECLERGEPGKADFRAARAEHVEWRRRALGFKLLVERRQRAVRQRMQSLHIDGTAVANRKGLRHQRNLDALFVLASAVADHRRAVSGPGEDEPEDEELWDALGSVIVVTNRGEMTLGDWVAHVEDLRVRHGEAS